MSYIDPHDELPPPPAYSPEEFDRKISTTIQLSLSTPQPQPSLDDDEWEVWDEAAFQAAAQTIAAGGSSSAAQAGSSTHPVEPLKIKKKGLESYTSSKPRPSWLDQAESAPQDAHSSQRGAPNNTAPMSIDVHQLPEDEDEDHPSHPPPAFTPNAPSLDGPPYEQVVSPPWVADGSSAGSPLNSPTTATQQFVYPEPPDDIPAQIRPPQAEIRQRSPQRQVNMQNRMPQPQGDMHLRMPQGDMHHRIPRHSLPSAPQRTHHAAPQWPVSEYSTPKPTPMPISTFDHSVAYNQESNYGRSQAPISPQAPAADYYNATAFYNAAVASHLKPRPSQNHHAHHMPSNPQYYPAPNHPTQRPYDSGSYARGSLTPVRNPAAPRFSQYSQYSGSHMTPHLPR